jgi:hypothetical protein
VVTVDELLRAVMNALGGGGPAPTVETSALTPVSPGQPTHVELSDGTAVDFSAVSDLDAPPGTPFTRVQLSREESDVDLSRSELEAVGTMRGLSFEPFEQDGFANNDNGGVGRLHAADFIPTLTLPRRALGTADPEAVVVARVGDIYVDGQLQTDAVRFLPAFANDAGNLQARDIYFPQSILSDLEARAALTSRDRAAAIQPRRVRYVLASLLTSANWGKEPKLVRMVPSASSAAYRVPLDVLAQSDPERAKTEQRRCVNNLVVLVHGHNEEEGAGFLPPKIGAPWEYAYKRDVWTLFYDHLLRNDPKARLACTAFYEFIYPTYRPVITPSGGVKRLDESFAEALGKELKPFLDSGDDYRLYVVAHSMGGIVSRAGVQVMDPKLDRWLKKLVTWGSPHLGSPLPSMAFALAAAPPYVLHTPPGWPGVGIDISGIDALYELLIEGISSVQVPAPGPRDYRWARSSTSTPHEINLDNVLDLSESQEATLPLLQRFNFTDGTWLYSNNLRLLNANDRHIHDGKYATLFGVTTKRLKWTWKKTLYGYISYPDPSDSPQTGIGAYAMELFMDPTPLVMGKNNSDSDGAVPVASMIASGVVGLPDIYDLGDVDHEEYYGAPDATGSFTASVKATHTAQTTLLALKVLSDDVACPSFTFTKTPNASYEPSETIEIVASLVWPGDQTPGSRIATLTAEADGGIGQLALLTFNPDGAFSGSFPAPVLPSPKNFTLTLLANFKDGTELKKSWPVAYVVKVPTINPASVTLSPNTSQQFTSDMPVVWSIQEGPSGGTITSGGFYTSPNTVGTYHVVATSQADPTKSASATVTVAQPGSFTSVTVGTGPAIATGTNCSGVGGYGVDAYGLVWSGKGFSVDSDTTQGAGTDHETHYSVSLGGTVNNDTTLSLVATFTYREVSITRWYGSGALKYTDVNEQAGTITIDRLPPDSAYKNRWLAVSAGNPPYAKDASGTFNITRQYPDGSSQSLKSCTKAGLDWSVSGFVQVWGDSSQPEPR